MAKSGGRPLPKVVEDNFDRLEDVPNSSNRSYFKCKHCPLNSPGAHIENRDNNLPKHLTDATQWPNCPPGEREAARHFLMSKIKGQALIATPALGETAPLSTAKRRKKGTLDGLHVLPWHNPSSAMFCRFCRQNCPQIVLPTTLTTPKHTYIQRSSPTTAVIIHKIFDLAVLLVELINYAPLGHAFERLNLENMLGMLQHGSSAVEFVTQHVTITFRVNCCGLPQVTTEYSLTMDVQGLWEVMSQTKRLNLAVNEGFWGKHSGKRAFRIGIDTSIKILYTVTVALGEAEIELAHFTEADAFWEQVQSRIGPGGQTQAEAIRRHPELGLTRRGFIILFVKDIALGLAHGGFSERCFTEDIRPALACWYFSVNLDLHTNSQKQLRRYLARS
ncbi:hypothetical protein BDR06DRAFT_1061768 [Suillus hirtellus]|nr:hypothetical protein BDR06DRAFT_1061768 [Suillus hirtellus]